MILVKFKKKINPLLGQMGNFGSTVAQHYANVHLRICSKDFFAKFAESQAAIKVTEVKYPKNYSFVPNGQFWWGCGPKLWRLIPQDLF